MIKKQLLTIRAILTLIACFFTGTMLAQKIDLDTLAVDQLNQYRHKAVSMRNTGMILTIIGVGIVATGIIYENTPGTPNPDTPGDHSHQGIGLFTIAIADMIGITTTIIGVPLWAVGETRRTKAEITLQKVNISPMNSMALGLEISFRF